MQDNQQEFLNNSFSISFQLVYKTSATTGTDSVFYAGRSLTADFEKIYDLIRYDGLFISHNCVLKMDLNKSKCTIFVENWDLSPVKKEAEDTLAFIIKAIENKLTRANLYDHFFVSGNSSSPNVTAKTTFAVSILPGQLIDIHQVSHNQLEVDKLLFPQESIPPEFLCQITSELIDIPYFDLRQDENVHCEYRVFMKHVRRHHTNPFSRLVINASHCDYDYCLWDRIQTFLEKVRLAHSLQVSYIDNMKLILDQSVSADKFNDLLCPSAMPIDRYSAIKLYDKGLECMAGKRLINASYHFKMIVTGTFIEKPVETLLLSAKIHYALLCFKIKYVDEALAFFEELKRLNPTKNKDVYAEFLVEAARYFLQIGNYDLAKSVATKAKKYIFNDLMLSKKCEQILLLQSLRCQDNFKGHCIALRRAANEDKPDRLIQCIDLLNAVPSMKDTNPKTGYTAMHLAIKNSNSINAWLVHLAGFDFDIKSNKWYDADGGEQNGVSCRELIAKTTNVQLKCLLSPYMYITLNCTNQSNDAEISGLMNTHEQLLKIKMGLNDEVDLIYIPIKRILIFSNFYSPNENFQHFISSKWLEIPELFNCLRVSSICNLEDQECPYQRYQISFILKIIDRPRFIQLFQNQVINTQRFLSNQVQLNEQFIKIISQACHDSGLSFAPEISVSTDYNSNQIALSMTCKCAHYLLEYLKECLNKELIKHAENVLSCHVVEIVESSAMLDNDLRTNVLRVISN